MPPSSLSSRSVTVWSEYVSATRSRTFVIARYPPLCWTKSCCFSREREQYRLCSSSPSILGLAMDEVRRSHRCSPRTSLNSKTTGHPASGYTVAIYYSWFEESALFTSTFQESERRRSVVDSLVVEYVGDGIALVLGDESLDLTHRKSSANGQNSVWAAERQCTNNPASN